MSYALTPDPFDGLAYLVAMVTLSLLIILWMHLDTA